MQPCHGTPHHTRVRQSPTSAFDATLPSVLVVGSRHVRGTSAGAVFSAHGRKRVKSASCGVRFAGTGSGLATSQIEVNFSIRLVLETLPKPAPNRSTRYSSTFETKVSGHLGDPGRWEGFLSRLLCLQVCCLKAPQRTANSFSLSGSSSRSDSSLAHFWLGLMLLTKQWYPASKSVSLSRC
jgi:hypothetical protein